MERNTMVLCLSVIVILMSLIPVSRAALASTWDYCGCAFEPWQSWEVCTTDCFGQRVRERNASFLSNPGCDEFSDCATEDERFEWGSCNTVCQNGGTPTGKVAAPCSCRVGYYGTCCASRVNCSVPANITNGEVSVTTTFYGDTITYSCNPRYNLTNGDEIRTCQNFTWGGVEPECVFADHCSSSPCQNNATCIDLLDDFSCNCADGWTGPLCDVDMIPPVVTGCSDDVMLNASSHTVTYNWTAPAFTDPQGTAVNVTSNYPAPGAEFKWGDHVVSYTATKVLNGQQASCTFSVRVRPNQCDELNIPLNGARLCNGWRTDYGRYCLITCLHNYTLGPTYSFHTWRVCGASGTWLASSPLPDCRLPVHTEADAIFYQSEFPIFSFVTSCEDPATQNALRQLYIEQLKAHRGFSQTCTNHPDACVPENVNISCNA